MSASVPAPDPRRWRALSVMLMGQFVTLLDISVTNVALPSIGRSTGADASELQWIVTGYVLAFALVPVIGGRLGDGWGRRRVFTIAMLGFVAASAAVGLAPTAGLLIAARVVQGVFGGMMGPQVSGFIQNAFPTWDRGRAFGRLGLTVGAGTALGPVIAGVLIAAGGPEFGWRLVFFVNVPIGIAAVLLARRWVPADEPVPAASGHRVDVLGAALLGAGVLCLLFPIVETGQGGGPVMLLLLVPAVVFLFAFVRHEARLTRAEAGPLLDLRLFRTRSFVTGIVFAVVFFCSNTGIPLVLALYYQDGLGFTALQSGLGVTAYAVGSVFGAPVAGRFVSRVGRPLLLVAVGVFTAVTVVLGVLVQTGADATDPLTVILRLCVPLFLLGIAAGAIVTPNQTLTLAEVDPRRGGVAGGVVQTSQRVGASIGQTVLGTTFVLALGGAARAIAPGSPAPDPSSFAHALTLALGVSVVFSGVAIVLSAVEVRRLRGR
ncbi:hypothetical protein CH252_21645 [Rhodococcus sp. 06-1477-1B]|nr:hypothetical protein CH252_21645 [Rhodococcus sp. 06-1477-1B]